MGCPCTNCEKPPCEGGIMEVSFRTGSSNPTAPHMSAAAALGAAEADLAGAAWSAYGGAPGTAQTIVSALGGGLFSAFVSDFRFRAKHARTGTCYLRQKFFRTTSPATGTTLEVDYEWTAANSADCADIWTGGGTTNYVESAQLGEVNHPALAPGPTGNQSIFVSLDDHYSCLAGYYPAGADPDGFPI